MIESCPYVKARPFHNPCNPEDWVKWKHKKAGKCSVCYDDEAEAQLQREEELNMIERETLNQIEKTLDIDSGEAQQGSKEESPKTTKGGGSKDDEEATKERPKKRRKRRRRGQKQWQRKQQKLAPGLEADHFVDLTKLPEGGRQWQSVETKQIKAPENALLWREQQSSDRAGFTAGLKSAVACRWLRWEQIDAYQGAWTGSYRHGSVLTHFKSGRDVVIRSSSGLDWSREVEDRPIELDLLLLDPSKRPLDRCDS